MNLQEIKSSDPEYTPPIDASDGNLRGDLTFDVQGQKMHEKSKMEALKRLQKIITSKPQIEAINYSQEKDRSLTTFYINGFLEIPGITPREQTFKISYNETSAHFDNVDD